MMDQFKYFLWLIFLFLISSVIFASEKQITHTVPRYEHPYHLNEQEYKRYQAINYELRCLVCQNQNLAESSAPLAKDLREKVANLIKQGKKDDEIKEYLQYRYGDFVLYMPPFTQKTYFLWLGPFILLLLGSIIVISLIIRSRLSPKLISEALIENKMSIREKI